MVEVTESARKERISQEQNHQHEKELIQRSLADAGEEIVGLRNKLQLYHDYDEVKRELEILKVRPSTFPETSRVC